MPLPLPVSAPFHSSLMKPAAERLKAALADIELQALAFPVINNVDVAVAHRFVEFLAKCCKERVAHWLVVLERCVLPERALVGQRAS
jgi:malonyl CoA-acyl carrier protein transacylase